MRIKLCHTFNHAKEKKKKTVGGDGEVQIPLKLSI